VSEETGHKAYLSLRAKMTPEQAELLDCALDLYKAAATVVYVTKGADAVPALCTAGALAESYSAIFWRLNALLRRKLGREKVSVEETEAEWHRYFDWIVKAEIRPPITTQAPSGKDVAYTFDLVHKIATQALKNFRAYRKEVRSAEC